MARNKNSRAAASSVGAVAFRGYIKYGGGGYHGIIYHQDIAMPFISILISLERRKRERRCLRADKAAPVARRR